MWWGVVPYFFKCRLLIVILPPKGILWKSKIWLYIGNIWQMLPLLGYQSDINNSSKPHCLYSLLMTCQRGHSSLWAFSPPRTSAQLLEKHQTIPNWGTSYKIPERCSSKLSRSSKNSASLRNCHSQEKHMETWQLNATWYPGKKPRTHKMT